MVFWKTLLSTTPVVTGKVARNDGHPGSPGESSGHVFFFMKNRPLRPKGSGLMPRASVPPGRLRLVNVRTTWQGSGGTSTRRKHTHKCRACCETIVPRLAVPYIGAGWDMELYWHFVYLVDWSAAARDSNSRGIK